MLFHVAVAAAGEAETPATMGWSLMDLSPAVMRMGRPPLLNHGNLSGMLPERPQAFDADFEAKISHCHRSKIANLMKEEYMVSHI